MAGRAGKEPPEGSGRHCGAETPTAVGESIERGAAGAVMMMFMCYLAKPHQVPGEGSTIGRSSAARMSGGSRVSMPENLKTMVR